MFEYYCRDVLYHINQESLIHDMDFEREFEFYLCKMNIAVYNWCEAKGIFKYYKEKRQIKKLDKLVEQVFELYVNNILFDKHI